MSKMRTAATWVLVVATGTVASEWYKSLRKDRTPITEHIANYESDWKEALKAPQNHPPLDAKEVVAKTPPWQHRQLREKLAELDESYRPKYERAVVELHKEWQRAFSSDWEQAVDDFADPPDLGAAVEAVHEYHRAKLNEELTRINKEMLKKHPRTRLALDDFSGYCVFRCEEFKKKLTDNQRKLHLVDDKAVYNTRMDALKDGSTPLAVFTIDALLNSADFDGSWATIVMVIDETRGADAMVAWKKGLPNIEALNRREGKIVLPSRPSPSETLARVVRSKFKLNKLPKDCFVTPDVKGAASVLAMFHDADPAEPTAFVLWEPYLSKLLKQHPGAHVLADSANFTGHIVDVLVANRDYLSKQPDEVKDVIRAYLESAQLYQKSAASMVKLVVADAPTEKMTDEEGDKVVRGIWWKTTRDNYRHFGLLPVDAMNQVQSLEEMIRNIYWVLEHTGAISRKIKPEQLFDKSTLAQLQKEGFDPGEGSMPPPPALPVLADDDWKRLQPVGLLQVEPIQFGRGSKAIPPSCEPTLEELANTMRTSPQYYLQIRGHALGNSEADQRLARDRAKEVARWLEETGGIRGHRMQPIAIIPSGSGEETLVTFMILQLAR